MNISASFIGTLGFASIMASPAPSTVKAESLRQITGAELKALIVNSAVLYGHPAIRGGNYQVFGSDYRYKFVTPEPWIVNYSYSLDHEKIVIDAKPQFSIRVFVDRRRRHYLLVSDQLYASYQPVAIRHPQPGHLR